VIKDDVGVTVCFDGLGFDLSSHFPIIEAPQFSQETSDGPRSHCEQATIFPPAAAVAICQLYPPQVSQGPSELKSW